LTVTVTRSTRIGLLVNPTTVSDLSQGRETETAVAASGAPVFEDPVVATAIIDLSLLAFA